jgi:hypothetical protein
LAAFSGPAMSAYVLQVKRASADQPSITQPMKT